MSHADTTDIPGTTMIGQGERTDLLETLRKHRFFMRYTVRDLTDEQAAQRTTVSALTLLGLIKHVVTTEQGWAAFITGGAEGMAAVGPQTDEPADVDWSSAPDPRFIVEPQETLAILLARYEDIARQTDDLVTQVDLDAAHPLPVAPWFEPDKSWSARRVLLHVIAETAQHAGHADIIRESLDGAKSMG